MLDVSRYMCEKHRIYLALAPMPSATHVACILSSLNSNIGGLLSTLAQAGRKKKKKSQHHDEWTLAKKLHHKRRETVGLGWRWIG